MVLIGMIMMGGSELLLLCALLGAVFGYIFRNKNKKNSAVLGIILGVAGAVLTSWLLASFVYPSYIAMLAYSVLGAWLFNFIASKIK